MAEPYMPDSGPRMTYTDYADGTLSIEVRERGEYPVFCLNALDFVVPVDEEAAFQVWLRKAMRAARKRWTEGV